MTTPTRSDRNAPSTEDSGLRAAGAAVALLLAGGVVNVGAGVAALAVFGFESIQRGGIGFLVAAVLGQALVFGVAYAYVRWRSQRVPFGVPSREESLVIGGGVVVSVLAAVGLTLLRERFVPTDTTSGLAEVFTANPSLALLVGVLSVLLIAPAEELLFRGAIQGRLRSAFGPGVAVVGASALFAAWHLLNFGGSVLGAVLAAGIIGAVSLLWGYAYERTGNFAVPVLTHGLYNLALLVMAYLSL